MMKAPVPVVFVVNVTPADGSLTVTSTSATTAPLWSVTSPTIVPVFVAWPNAPIAPVMVYSIAAIITMIHRNFSCFITAPPLGLSLRFKLTTTGPGDIGDTRIWLGPIRVGCGPSSLLFHQSNYVATKFGLLGENSGQQPGRLNGAVFSNRKSICGHPPNR